MSQSNLEARTRGCASVTFGAGASRTCWTTPCAGSYAEFIVAAALGIDLSEARVNWEPWDLTFRDSIRVEVKSCSYLQAWEQTRPSDIKFSIRPAIRWTATGGWAGEQRGQSDVYVFCLFTEKDPGGG